MLHLDVIKGGGTALAEIVCDLDLSVRLESRFPKGLQVCPDLPGNSTWDFESHVHVLRGGYNFGVAKR
jgi:hypothetical protein